MGKTLTIVLALTCTPAVAATLTATDPLVVHARAALKKTLKDPGSAQFAGEYVGHGAVCGIVNAKNSYGGYGGQTVYLYVPQTGEVSLLEQTGNVSDDEATAARFDRYCKTQ